MKDFDETLIPSGRDPECWGCSEKIRWAFSHGKWLALDPDSRERGQYVFLKDGVRVVELTPEFWDEDLGNRYVLHTSVCGLRCVKTINSGLKLAVGRNSYNDRYKSDRDHKMAVRAETTVAIPQ